MIIECAGTRGSIARGGQEFCRFGGDTISVRVISDSGDIIIVDAGTGIQMFGNEIASNGTWDSPKQIHILFTHYHMDHIVGIPFFKPIFNPAQKITMYGPLLEGTDGVGSAFRNMIVAPYSPITFDGHEIKADFSFETINEMTFSIGSLKITTIRINHTNLGGLGYKFEENGKTFILLSDNELQHPHENGRTFEEYAEFCKNADLVFHDAQFTDKEYPQVKGWGHSTIEDVVRLGNAAKCRKVGMFHYAPDRTDNEINQLYTPLSKKTEPGMTHFFPLTQQSKFIL